MPCYSPLQAFYGPRGASGKPSIVFKRSLSVRGKEVMLPCGNCIGCRLERSRQWALRCWHESTLHEKNCFITLTYDEGNVPPDGSVHLEDFQLFMKRLRKKFGEVRYFHCGEYGETTLRPHYHALLFGFDFSDKYFWKEERGNRLYRSPDLEKLWPVGNSLIGSVTFKSAAYVARYIMKKVTGEAAAEHYQGRAPEYVTMSRRPGIGAGWYAKWGKEVYPDDFVVHDGVKMKPPKFYDSKLEIMNCDEFKRIKNQRVAKANKLVPHITKDGRRVMIVDNNLFVLKVKEQIKQSRISQLKRSAEV